MPFLSEIGDSVENLNVVKFEWKIKDFLSLSEKADDFYHSPIFSFSDSFWYLVVYPNGQSRNHSVDWIDLYLAREDYGAPKTVSIRLGIKDSGVQELYLQGEFSNSQREIGETKYLSRAAFLKCKDDIMPSNILTVHCKLTCHDANIARISVVSRLRKVGRNLQSVLSEGNSADFTLFCKDRRWPVHKAILASRSEYFETMFRNSWAESTSGVVKFTEIDGDALDSVLNFIYAGEVEDLSDDNVSSLYTCANTFVLEDLKAVCVDYMKRNMGPDVVFGALRIADTYMEEELMELSIKYVINESDQIFEEEKWKQLKVENPPLAMKILEKTLAKEGEINKRIKLTASTQQAPPSQMLFPFGTKAPMSAIYYQNKSK